MISLAAAYWKLDPQEAALKLSDETTPEQAAEHEAYGRYADGFAAMVADARAAPAARLKGTLQKLFLTGGDRDRWAKRLGRFCGVSSRSRFEQAYRGGAVKNWSGAGRPLFPGRGWTDTLVVPFYDLPGRLRSTWTIGRDARDEDVVFHSVPERNRNGRIGETGLGFLDAVLGDPDPEFGDTVFVIDDVRTALRVHDKHFQQSDRPLPVLASHARGKLWARLDNGVLAGRRLVFWGLRTTKELVRQAYAGDGLVAAADGVRETPARFLGRYAPRTWLRHVLDAAVHWTAALERLIADLPDPEAEAAVEFVGMTTADRQRFLTACGPATRDRLTQRIFGKTMARRIHIDGHAILAANGVWYLIDRGRNKTLLTDAPFLIEKVIQFQDRRETFYQVAAVFRGRTVRFTVPVETFERDPLNYVRREVMRAGVGLAAVGNRWSGNAVSIATQLHEPEFVVGADRCGWNETRAAWVFTRFSVTARGDVLDGLTVPLPGRDAPTAALPPPADPHPDDVSLLSRFDESTQLVWGTAAAVLANLVAPVANRDPSGVAAGGEGAAFVARAAARALGCHEFSAFADKSRAGVESLAAREREHGWPIVLHRTRNYRGYLVNAWLGQPGPRNAVIDLDRYAAAVVGLQGGWHVIESDRVVTSVTEYRRALAGLVPAFLLWFGRQGLALPDGETFGDSVLEAMSDWFAAIGGDPTAVRAARRLVTFDHVPAGEEYADRLADVLCRLTADGSADLSYTESGNLFVPMAGLNKLLASKGAPVLDTVEVTRALAEAGVLVRESTQGVPPQPGWEVSSDWWEGRHASWGRRHGRGLRIVG